MEGPGKDSLAQPAWLGWWHEDCWETPCHPRWPTWLWVGLENEAAIECPCQPVSSPPFTLPPLTPMAQSRMATGPVCTGERSSKFTASSLKSFRSSSALQAHEKVEVEAGVHCPVGIGEVPSKCELKVVPWGSLQANLV